MALSILDGNQSATTLSTILSSGQHIPAHTVVSLGTQAITDMRGAVSGSVVSVSNFPSTQTIAGTVTVGNTVTIAGSVTVGNTVSVTGGLTDTQLRANAFSVYTVQPPSSLSRLQVDISDASGNAGYGTTGDALKISGSVTLAAGTAQIGSVTASISNSVTIASLPAISGTVTANLSISSTVITSGSFSSLTSATLVPANPARKMATVFNLGAGQLFVNAGATATTLGGGFMVALSSGDFYECDYTTTTLSAIFATAGTASWVSH